ncbi:hypothetical protein [Streptomyces sp. NPDC055094]
MADNTAVGASLHSPHSFGNASADLTASTSGIIRNSQFRCDSTMKTSRRNDRRGCVAPGYTPTFELPSVTPEQTWHVEKAIQSGLPGAPGRPLHRQADKGKRDIKRQ